MKKKVDARVRALIEACVASNHRSLFVIVGDKGRHQVVNLHYILSKATVKARPSVLWCYKKELGFSSHKQKRIKQLKKMAHRAGTDLEKMQEDPFELFIAATNIRYCYYSESHKVLGNTFGMCVLQDFEALTPNLLARTIETVEGGGVVLILLKTMDSLKQLYTMTMDVHTRFRTEAHRDVVARFNERFLLSLAHCSSALVVDDELNVLPISTAAKNFLAAHQPSEQPPVDPHAEELKELSASLKDTQPIGNLVALARTIDQAKCLLTFMEAVSDKTLRSTVALTAGRGRGKSAALGMSIAGAVAYGYSNIFVTSPSPENLNTLFEFILKGFDALEYKEHLDYQVIQSANPSFNNAIVRVNVFHSHRQTIQYVQPQHAHLLAQAELVVVDEAAAIPLPLVKKLMGPYLLFLSSTINGYEGTGRSLSLKLIQQLRESQSGKGSGSVGIRDEAGSSSLADDSAGHVRNAKAASKLDGDGAAAGGTGSSGMSSGGRLLRELKLEVPIRYSAGDEIESWLHRLLCLDATDKTPALKHGCPHPSECDLYYVERDTLFSHHKAAEDFLQGMMSLYVSSHYKNSPNDLQLLSDAPNRLQAHQLFVLLGPVDAASTATPDIICVLQVCLEGQISKESVLSQLSRGYRQAGDLIPWTIAQQFQDADFAGLSGARVVRIATHPELTKMGYGGRAIDLLSKYFAGQLVSLDEVADSPAGTSSEAVGDQGVASSTSASLTEEKIGARKALPPLLVPLSQRRPEPLDYLGVSFGITSQLQRFWRRQHFQCVYLRQTASELTGEHTAIFIRQLEGGAASSPTWLSEFEADFKRRFVSLLAYEFRAFPPPLPLAILEPSHVSSGGAEGKGLDESEGGKRAGGSISVAELSYSFTQYDLKRLEAYAANIVDHHIIMDLVPALARLYFLDRVPLALSFTQAACLLGIGLQNKSIDDLTAELNLEARQLLANFNKVIVRLTKFLRGLREAEAETGLGRKRTISDQTLAVSLDEELTKGAKSAHQHLLAKAEGSVAGKGAPGGEYAVPDDDEAWREVLSKTPKGAIPTSVSIPKKRQTIGGQLEGRDQADGAHEGERSHKKKKFGEGKGAAGGKGKGAKGSKRHSS